MTNETTASQPKSIGDDAIEAAALKHVATSWGMLPVAAYRSGDYKQTEQFKRLKAFALELLDSRAPAGQASAEVVRNNVPGSPHNVCRTTEHNLRKRIAELEAQASATIQAAPNWKLGTWFEARTLDEMEAFYMSRLPMIREAAKEHGYAIGLHGTARRDFDLMAMQWRADASDKDSLARAIADAACGIRREGSYDWEKKPMGRVATSIPVCWTDHSNPDFDKPSVGHIDLSIIELAATIQEPVMVAEPVDAFADVIAENERIARSNMAKSEPAAPMVADPAGVALEVVYLRNMFGFWHVSTKDTEGAIAFSAATVKAVPSEALSGAARDVLAERQRQVDAEGWTPEHDDAHNDGSMAQAAACYAYPELVTVLPGLNAWPWAEAWFKVRDPRRNYVRAAALLLAEIERIDRAAPLADKTGGGE